MQGKFALAAPLDIQWIQDRSTWWVVIIRTPNEFCFVIYKVDVINGLQDAPVPPPP